MIKVLKLKAKIIEKGYTIDSISKEIGIDKSTFHRKMQKDSFLVKEVALLKKILCLSKDEADDIFFGN